MLRILVYPKNNFMLMFFCLAKKNQKPKAKDQFQLFSPTKSLRNTTKKIAIRSLSPKAAALLLTYELVENSFDLKIDKIHTTKFTLNFREACVRDANENPFAWLLQKIVVTARPEDTPKGLD